MAALAALTALSAVAPAHAATLQISPVMIEFDPSAVAVGLTLRNPGDQPLYGQVRVYKWNQVEGKDDLVPTEDLIASPPLIQVAAGGNQLVRLVRRNTQPVTVEQSYRLLIDELPQPQDNPTAGVNIRLRYSVPVFVLPMGSAGQPALTWQLQSRDHHWFLDVENRGTKRAQIAAVTLQAANGTQYVINKGLLGYALAGNSREWEVPIPDGAPLGTTAKLQVMINAATSEMPATVVPAR